MTSWSELVGLDTRLLTAWRLDRAEHASTWESGEGARLGGGRWNSPGLPVIYASIDPATAILEVAVHKGFKTLNIVPHVMTSIAISDITDARVLQAHDVPNPNWLVSSFTSEGQQEFGDGLLLKHPFVILPSVVSRESWNVLINPQMAKNKFSKLNQTRFALDPRLNPLQK